MRILVTGKEGQVARSLEQHAETIEGMELIRVGRPDFDLLNPESVREAIGAAKPDIVVSSAAYTAVEQAEAEPELAFGANAIGAGLVAEAAAGAGAAIIHLSTDFVFSGTQSGDHIETDPTGPLSIYGLSKLDGEHKVAAANPRHVILRTAWVYSPFGRNFVKTMLGLARERDTVRVVGDQWGNPTSAGDIAKGILRIAARVSEQRPKYGVFHLAGQGHTSWAGFAREIFAESERLGGPFAAVQEITTAEFPTKAARPRNSRLSCAKLFDAYRWQPGPWQESLGPVVARLLIEG
ncbi:MAG: dTDP-4-dehydrorhamnose reductase [Mesorhizobium sp.]|nr:dTDP-4-dehydrorhamnose reductase [Mesorhizobium sp.]MBL8578939.1 dTDP-4-dehydrorhamnose reductase [Mesorhizobium sp.]